MNRRVRTSHEVRSHSASSPPYGATNVSVFRNQRWRFIVLDFKRRLAPDQVLTIVAPFGVGQCQLKADAIATFHRRHEPHLIQPIVEDGGSVLWRQPQLHRERCDKRQAKKAVCNGHAHWTFLAGSLDVGMNPLPVAGASCKLVNHRLIDLDPVRRSKVPAHKVLDRRERNRCHFEHLFEQ